MGFHFFPSEFIYWTKNKKHDEMKDVLMKWVDDHDHKYISNKFAVVNGCTSYSCDTAQDFFTSEEILTDLVHVPFNDMLRKCDSIPHFNDINIDEYRIASAWHTKYKTGGYFGTHNHTVNQVFDIDGRLYSLMFSVIYILNDENERNSTNFFVPRSQLSATADLKDYRFETSSIPGIGEGSIIIFPSSLYHEVLPCIKPDRITISYNILCARTCNYSRGIPTDLTAEHQTEAKS